MPPPTSAVWKYFKRNNDGNTVKCTLCSQELKMTGGTSNMRNHLKGKHPSHETGQREKENQSSMTLFVNTPKKTTSSQKEKITQAIADMVVLDYIPLSIVEGDGFRNLMEIVAPNYTVPCRNTIRSCIVKRYDEEKISLTSELDSADPVSLTTDTWTSSATESYITVTEHHIDSKWEMHSNVLVTRAMLERHTGENIAAKLKSCVSEFGVDQKVSTVVHDNARNMENGLSVCEDWDDLSCFGHTLQLCIKPSLELPSVSKLVSKCRKLVGHFKHSTTITAEIGKRQKMLNVPEHQLIQDVPTRWNSTQLMLQRLFEQRRVINDLMLDTSFTKKNDASLLLSNQEWETVNDLSTTLEPLTAVTTYMSKEKSVSCSVVYPVVCGLLNKSLKVTSEDNSVVRKVKESIAMELNKRYLPTDVNTAKTTPVIASLLDPRYKKLLFLNPDQRKTAESTLDAMLDETPLKMAQTRTDEPSAKRSRVECALDFLDFTSPEKCGSDDDELKSYLCEKTSSDNTLTWWKERESKYP